MKQLSKSSVLPSVLIGLSSGIGYALASKLIIHKNNNINNSNGEGETSTSSLSKNNKKKNLLNFKMILFKLRNRSKRMGINWSMVFMIHILSQLRTKQASIALPLLYLLLGNVIDDGNVNENDDSYDRDDRDGDDDEKKERKESSRGVEIKTQTDGSAATISNDVSTNTSTNTATISIVPSFPQQSQTQSQIQTKPPPIQRLPENQYRNRNRNRSRSNSVLTQTSETSTGMGEGANAASVSIQNTRYIELLVHNVSHTDLVLCLGIPEGRQSKQWQADMKNQNQHKNKSNANVNAKNSSSKTFMGGKEEAHALCRPQFSSFDRYCRRVLSVLNLCLELDNEDENENENEAAMEQRMAKIQQLRSCIMSFPQYGRNESTPQFSFLPPVNADKRQVMLPLGFNLSQLVNENEKEGDINNNSNSEERKTLDLSADDMKLLRVREKDLHKIEGAESNSFPSSSADKEETPKRKNGRMDSDSAEKHEVSSSSTGTSDRTSASTSNSNTSTEQLHLDAIFFPLLSSLLRRWNGQITDKYEKTNVKKVLILVSGVGTPSIRTQTNCQDGNSTEAISQLMELFINVLYPDVVVVRIHSKREIFRYDENITFAKKELLPCINAYRDAHAKGDKYPDEIVGGNDTTGSIAPFDPDWKQSFSVTLSFADGAGARTYAIQSSLRSYRPTYFHFWQLKTFWHTSKICDDDIEVHSFESMETVPAMEVHKTNPAVQMVVQEMKRFRQHFLKTLGEGDNDIRKFWLRKTKKPVLSVLLVKCPGESLVTYRGMNMEVSMPTGSLCAERNVIGTALATHPNIRRQDIVMVAVLALTLPNENPSPSPLQLPSPPPGTSSMCTLITETKEPLKESSVFFSEVEEKLSRFQRPENMRRSISIGSFASIVEGSDSHETDDSWEKMSSNEKTSENSSEVARKKSLESIPKIITEAIDSVTQTGLSTPVRKIKLYAGGDTGNNRHDNSKTDIFRRKKRTVIVHSAEDINPLNPCGACNEWLKKISEFNPNFKIITFTDANCNGVYVASCQD